MPIYKIYPAVDESYKFPPIVRQAMALYTELTTAFAAKFHSHSYADISATELGTQDLNTIVTQGDYSQAQNADTALETNYPVALAGLLAVRAFGTSFVFQDYTTYTAPIRKFYRTKYQTTWNDWVEVGNTDLMAPKANPTFTGTVTGITKAMVGLGNVNNTADVDKPVPNSILNLPLGLLVQAKNVVNVGPYGSGETVCLSIPSVLFKAGRKYRIELSFEYSGTNIGDCAAVNINTSSTADAPSATTGLTKKSSASVRVHDVGKGLNMDTVAYMMPTSDTTLQIKATAFVWDGTGTVLMQAGATNPMLLSVFDEGAQF